MDVIELVRADHQRIQSLFNQVKAESGRQQTKLLIQNILRDADLSFYAMDNVFYTAFKNYPDFTHVIRQSIDDQTEIKGLLAGLVQYKEDSTDFQNCVLELKNHYESHCVRQEEDLFPLVRKEMKRPDRERLGRHFQAVKQEREESAA